MSKLKIAFWVIFVATLGVYATMLFWSLPTIAAAAGGLAPFDLRPGGYSYDEAKAFLAALPSEQIEFYRSIQIGILDTLYPAMLAITLFLAIGLLSFEKYGKLAWVLALIAIPGSVFDYMENVNIRLMLFLGPNNINADIVENASARTESKAMFTTTAMSVLLILIVIWAWGRLVSRRT